MTNMSNDEGDVGEANAFSGDRVDPRLIVAIVVITIFVIVISCFIVAKCCNGSSRPEILLPEDGVPHRDSEIVSDAAKKSPRRSTKNPIYNSGTHLLTRDINYIV